MCVIIDDFLRKTTSKDDDEKLRMNIRMTINNGKREPYQRTELRHDDDCDFEGWITAVCIPIVDRHPHHRELVWTRAVHSVTFKRKTLHSVGRNVTRNSLWHPQYQHIGVGKPMSPVARWDKHQSGALAPTTTEEWAIINLGYSEVKRLYISL